MVSGERWIDLVKEELKEAKRLADLEIKENIEPIAHVGTPEKLIGKKYFSPIYERNWTKEDILMLYQIYGQEKIDDFIAKKEIEDLHRLEEM